ncbi:tetratricopeptide repeat protein [bacterium AH-315-M05]|nr:tetratricopeptide repeat protein [bacterium AH-315-M05]
MRSKKYPMKKDCHSERSEESPCTYTGFNTRGFLAALGMTITIYLLSASYSFAQQSKIDSLLTVLQTATDTARVNILSDLCWEYKNKDPDKGLEYGIQGLNIAMTLKHSSDVKIAKSSRKCLASLLNTMGLVYKDQGNYAKAISHFTQSLKINEEIKYKTGIAHCLNNIGLIYMNTGNYEKALNNYLQALKIYEEIKTKSDIAMNLTNIGHVYGYLNNYKKSMEYYLKALKIRKETDDKKGIAQSFINIGIINDIQGNYSGALDYYEQSLNLYNEMGDKRGIAFCLNNMGVVYYEQKNYKKALDFFLKSLNKKEELNDKKGISGTLINIGSIYSELGNHESAIRYLQKSIKIAKQINSKEVVKEAYHNLSEIYFKQNQYKKAFEHHQLYSEIKDSLFNEESSKQIAEMQEKYESEKREKEIELLNKEKALQSIELNRQKIIIWSGAGGLLLVIALAFFIYRGYRQKQTANVLLAAQKKDIETKNKDITDSIRYAENIQHAILPTDEQIKELLPDSFVLFKPKDIVSGDFYWIAAIDSQGSPPAGGRGVLIAACDCTGHGVPGAFMSMMINSLLNEVVNDLGITKPNEILYEVRKGIINSLKQKGESGEQKDGMDAALCSIDFENMKLEYAGANNPLYLIRKGKLQQIKADKQPVGFLTEEQKPFTNHKITLQKGDTIYIFSDGYQDQFGGEKDKKFMAKRFRELLLSIQDKLMDEQKEILNKAIKDWQGNSAQVDDILVIGVKV